MTFVPLGEAAVLAYLPTEAEAVRLVAVVRAAAPAWLEDAVPAYATAGIFFDADCIRTPDVIAFLESLPHPNSPVTSGTLHVIPVCYELGPDLAFVADHLKLSPEDVIRLHTATEYTVHAVGFVPGFPYLGYLPAELCGVPRLASPRVRVEAGSVGLTGRQTGVYPLARPGGWPLIGRTPCTLVDVASNFFPLSVGDRVRFERIGEWDYGRRFGEPAT